MDKNEVIECLINMTCYMLRNKKSCLSLSDFLQESVVFFNLANEFFYRYCVLLGFLRTVT